MKILRDLGALVLFLVFLYMAGSFAWFISISMYHGYHPDEIKQAATEYESTTGQNLRDLSMLVTAYDDKDGNYHKPLLTRLAIDKYLIDPDNKLIIYKDHDPIFYGGPTFKVNKLLAKYNLSSSKLIPMQTISKVDAVDLIKNLSNGQSLYFETYKVNPPFKNKDSIILVFQNSPTEKEQVTLGELTNFISYFKSVVYTNEYLRPVIKITKDNVTLHIDIRLPDNYLE